MTHKKRVERAARQQASPRRKLNSLDAQEYDKALSALFEAYMGLANLYGILTERKRGRKGAGHTCPK